jgi:AAA ATPase domain
LDHFVAQGDTLVSPLVCCTLLLVPAVGVESQMELPGTTSTLPCTSEKASGAAEMPASIGDSGKLVTTSRSVALAGSHSEPLEQPESAGGGGPVGAISNGDAGPALRGRRREGDTLDRLFESARAGQSRVLILRGESGIGKSALLEYLVGRASGCRVARAAGVDDAQ